MRNEYKYPATLQDVTPPLNIMVILPWLDDETLAFTWWGGSGRQILQTVEMRAWEIRTLIDGTAGRSDRTAIGGDYYFSPNRAYIAIQSPFVRQIALAAMANLTNPRWLSATKSGSGEQFQTWMPDNRHFLFTRWQDWADPDLGQPNPSVALWLGDFASTETQRLLDGVAAAAPSPDGNTIAFLRQQDHLWKEANPRNLLSAQEKGITALELGFLNLKTQETITIGPAGYKMEEVKDTLRYWQIWRPVWSPDGALVVYVANDGNLWLVSEDGSWHQQITQGLDIVEVLWSPDGSKLVLRTMDKAWVIERPAR